MFPQLGFHESGHERVVGEVSGGIEVESQTGAGEDEGVLGYGDETALAEEGAGDPREGEVVDC